MNYYNEYDPFAAKWLVELIKQGLIPDGEVDTRSIVDVRSADLRGFAQCHFFAGIGGWSHALRLAGWPDDRPIWTGSCPCQPFSVAGKGKGKNDDRHLWPVLFKLISECKPPVVMGEQVAGKAGYGWFDGVRSDLEGEGYASRAVDIPACAVDAPHIRQRLYWCAVGDADSAERASRDVFGSGAETRSERIAQSSLQRGDMANACSQQAYEEQQKPAEDERGRSADGVGGRGLDYGQSDMADADDARSQGHGQFVEQHDAPGWQEPNGHGASHSFWDGAEWRTGADGKARRVKSGVRLLVDGAPNRVGRLRGYGNAIVPPLAAEVIKAFMETEI